MRQKLQACTAVVALLALAAGSATALPGPGELSGCQGEAAEAAVALVDEHATVDEVSRVGGLEVAVATSWLVPPGIPNALLRVGGAWCGVEQFNAAAAEHLPDADAATLAASFASVAAMQYLGEVAVRDVVAVGPVVTLVTVGGRHGATSTWTILVDHRGVREARFVTTGWDPALASTAVGDLEGITSLPGHTRTFTRTADGRVTVDATVADLWARSLHERQAALAHAASTAGADPGDDLAHTFEDGLTIKVSYGLSPYTPDTGVDTGVAQADRLRSILAGVVDHYEDFLRWGASDPFGYSGRSLMGQDTGLPEQAGYINVDSPLAPVCLACAFLVDAMEVHIALLFPELVHLLLDLDYPDHEQFVQTVIGHEMVHSLQGGYSDGQGSPFGAAFIEGTARASESLHDIAANSHHRGSIHYVDSGNGCQGFNGGQSWIEAQADGPFLGHSYDACYFWWTYFAEHGPEGLVRLLEAQRDALDSSEGDAAARTIRLLEVAAGGSAALDLARWGAAAAAGNDADGYTIPAGQTGDQLNWFELLRPAERAVALEAVQSVVVGNGGFRAYHVPQAATITELPQGVAAYTFDNVDRRLVPGEAVVGTALAAGQILVLVAPAAETFAGDLAVDFS